MKREKLYACKDRSCGADDCSTCYPSQDEVGANRMTPRALDAECYELHAAELALEGSRDDSLSDTQLLNFLETLFSGRFRNSVFICKDIFDERLKMDIRNDEKVHSGTTVRDLLQKAAKFEARKITTTIA